MPLREVARRRGCAAPPGAPAAALVALAIIGWNLTGEIAAERLQLVRRLASRRAADAARLDRPGDRPGANDVHRPVPRGLERVLVARVLEPVDPRRLVGRRDGARPGPRSRRTSRPDGQSSRNCRSTGSSPRRESIRPASCARPPAACGSSTFAARSGSPMQKAASAPTRLDVDGVLYYHFGPPGPRPGPRRSTCPAPRRAASSPRRTSRSGCRAAHQRRPAARCGRVLAPAAHPPLDPVPDEGRPHPRRPPFRIDVSADRTFQPSQYDLRQLSAQSRLVRLRAPDRGR